MDPREVVPRRFLSVLDQVSCTPVHVVWEVTLACNLRCIHCGSRAGKRRPDELSTVECLRVIESLARLGTREVTLIGGEVHLRHDWLELVRAIRAAGMDCGVQSGGRHFDEDCARRAAEAGLQAAGISIDGLEDLHDRLRGVSGSYRAALNALRFLREYGITTSCNTQIGSSVIPQLPEMLDQLIRLGVRNWQVQLTVAMGRAADHPELLLQPYEMLDLMPRLAELFQRGLENGLLLQIGNNIGYFGPYEGLLRGSGDAVVHWTRCNAGCNTMGIEADGTVKGCPSLPSRDYAGGNVRDAPLEEIWRHTPELAFARVDRGPSLWGFCRDCYYAHVCQAGCTWTSHSLLGRPGNNPYCHHRALALARHNLRERVEAVEPAPGRPFDHGRFEIKLETMNGAPARGYPDASPLERPSARPPRGSPLVPCRGCRCHVAADARNCPHCGGNIIELELRYRRKVDELRERCARLEADLRDLTVASPQS